MCKVLLKLGQVHNPSRRGEACAPELLTRANEREKPELSKCGN
jgi:hypothetical protein